MAANKENVYKLNYCIKLLAGNNVVLVEANNYESEIFVPQILNGRITFLNIIPNRRCCQNGGKSMKCSPNLQNDNDTRPLVTQMVEMGNDRQTFRMSAGHEREMPRPLANSTPAGVKFLKPRVELSATPNPYNSVSDSSLPTPEPVRRAVLPGKDIISNKDLIQIPRGVKVLPLYHNSMNGTPKKVGRLVATSSRGSQDLTNLSILNGSFRPPTTPSMSNSGRRISTANHSNYLKTPLGSANKWRKVITPMRTYTRRSDKPIMLRRSTTASSAKKTFMSKKVIPTFLVNPTQAPKVTHKIEMMKRKLIIDGKISISPKTFKRQQVHPMSPAQNLPHRKSLATKINLQPSASYVSSLPKSRHQMESLQMSAFDVLTNSNRFRSMTDKLNKQFRNGCINKAASTYNKYKLLSTVPPLQQDEQILDISRNSLLKTAAAGQQTNRKIITTKSVATQIVNPSSADLRTGFKI